MSRIGRLPVAIPAGVTVEVAANNVVTVTGPKGTLVKELPVEMEIKVEGEEVVVTRPSDLKKMKSLHGLTRTLINNMVVGVTNGYEKVISGLKRISKPGLRVYAGTEDIPRVLGGLGTAILSTNKGVITDKEARKLGVGGEVLCFVW